MMAESNRLRVRLHTRINPLPLAIIRGFGTLDEYLQKLVRELGEAINDAINESEEVNDAMERLRASGHNVILVLEATIAFADNPPERKEESPVFEEIPIEQRLARISDEDRKFLRNLKIKFDKDD